MKTTAAILVETGKPLELAELDIPALKPGQVLVEIAFSGVCHTQLSEVRGHRGQDNFLPHCLGHEASGTVRELGAGVTKVADGDRVVLSWIKGSGANVPGTVYGWDGRKVNAGGVTTFMRHAVISENRLTSCRPASTRPRRRCSAARCRPAWAPCSTPRAPSPAPASSCSAPAASACARSWRRGRAAASRSSPST